MQIEQRLWTATKGWEIVHPGNLLGTAQLVFVFGDTTLLKDANQTKTIMQFYPGAQVVFGSTAGEILGDAVYDNTIAVTAIHFDSSRVSTHLIKNSSLKSSLATGEALAKQVDRVGLKHLFVISNGIDLNGSDLIHGIMNVIPDIPISGGLTGDAERFKETLVGLNGDIGPKNVILLAFYGDKLQIGFAYQGGWIPFGPQRRVTKAEGNVLYELDGQSVLDLYKKYLGIYAKGLPATGLLFPLSVRDELSGRDVVRTLLGVDHEKKSMTFAGDIPMNCLASFMKASTEQLVDAACDAARAAITFTHGEADLAILVSCVGRKMVMKQRTKEELKAIQEVFGTKVLITGFYSYGEICPYSHGDVAALHNQTMTITTLAER
jgi:hypothetical protein